MILLDTNAVIWALAGHPRADAVLGEGGRLFISPVTLLELQFLVEIGRLRELPGHGVADVADDPRWQLDSPPSDALFLAALTLGWTRDPFDRLLVAHASSRRWRFATGDRHILGHLPSRSTLVL